jgi:uncharacterized protein (TIGR03118 family)
MKYAVTSMKTLALGLALSLIPSLTFAQHYKQTNLVSDTVGLAPTHDPSLINPWGLTRSSTTPSRPGSPWWVANNNSGTSTLYDGSGNKIPINGNGIVTIPPPKGSTAASTPTGTVFYGGPDFIIPKSKGGNGLPAVFLFATEDGTISAWNGGPSAVLILDNSDNGSPNGAVYKGLTTAQINGKPYLYATNFRSGKVEVYDDSFNPVHFGSEQFDPGGDGDHDADDVNGETIPAGFAPFNIQNIGGSLFVTYAKQDAPRHDPVDGDGLGFVVIYTPSGHVISHLQHGPWLNAPWGVVWTPRDFGLYSNSILVGNFRSGWIAAYNGFTGKFIDFVRNPDDSLVTIGSLWALAFGNNASAGPSTTLFFTAGLENEMHGLFGTLTPVDGLDGTVE